MLGAQDSERNQQLWYTCPLLEVLPCLETDSWAIHVTVVCVQTKLDPIQVTLILWLCARR